MHLVKRDDQLVIRDFVDDAIRAVTILESVALVNAHDVTRGEHPKLLLKFLLFSFRPLAHINATSFTSAHQGQQNAAVDTGGHVLDEELCHGQVSFLKLL